jgi:hypothetical protein
MNSFTIISSLVLYGFTLLCMLLPYKSGYKATGNLVGLVLGTLITLTLIGNLEYLVIFIWPLIVIFQIVFITYWTFGIFGRKKRGKIAVIILTFFFILILMQPWISDWTFSKKDVRKILSFHTIKIKDDFKILKNESGGFRDFYETFTLKISDADFNRISKEIKTSKNYKGYFSDFSNLPSADFKNNDTLDFETENHFEREYFSSKKMENGTYHFTIQLDKKDKELNYIGSDE